MLAECVAIDLYLLVFDSEQREKIGDRKRRSVGRKAGEQASATKACGLELI